MSHPQPGDYIDMHVHEGKPSQGIFIVESLMAHEKRMPVKTPGAAFTYGIHPWFLDENNEKVQVELVEKITASDEVIAIGEAGFDRLRGPSMLVQERVFHRQVEISEALKKPLIIHCVRAWDELLDSYRKMKPHMPWMVHGFRGKTNQAGQLLSKGLYLSVWFEYALRNESAALLRSLPLSSFFLETDGADVDIREIYKKVAGDVGLPVDELKSAMYTNYRKFFGING